MKAKTLKKQSQTDWDRLDKMSDEEIDTSEIPVMGEDFFRNADLMMPSESKVPITIRIDKPVLEWFKSQGKGYQTRMNAILKAYVKASLKEV